MAAQVGVAVMAEHERQEDRVAHPVRGVVHAADGFGDAVHAGDVGIAEGHAGNQAGDQHLFAGLAVVRLLHGGLEVLRDQANGMQGQAVADRVGRLAGVGLDSVGQRVHAGGGGDVRRQRGGDVRVEQRQNRADAVVQDAHLELAAGVGDHREERDLAAGACGGRDRHDRQHRALEGEGTFVVLDLAVVGQQYADRLGRVHRTAATHCQHAVDALAAIQLGGAVDVFAARVGLDVDDLVITHAGLVQAGIDAVEQAGVLHARVGDQQHVAQAQVGQVLAGTLAQARFHDDLGR